MLKIQAMLYLLRAALWSAYAEFLTSKRNRALNRIQQINKRTITAHLISLGAK